MQRSRKEHALGMELTKHYRDGVPYVFHVSFYYKYHSYESGVCWFIPIAEGVVGSFSRWGNGVKS